MSQHSLADNHAAITTTATTIEQAVFLEYIFCREWCRAGTCGGNRRDMAEAAALFPGE